MTVEVLGVPGMDYELGVWNPDQIASVEGAVLTEQGKIDIEIPASKNADYTHHAVVIHFRKG